MGEAIGKTRIAWRIQLKPLPEIFANDTGAGTANARPAKQQSDMHARRANLDVCWLKACQETYSRPLLQTSECG